MYSAKKKKKKNATLNAPRAQIQAWVREEATSCCSESRDEPTQCRHCRKSRNSSRTSERSKLAARDERKSYHTRLPFAGGKEALPLKKKGGGGGRGFKAMFERTNEQHLFHVLSRAEARSKETNQTICNVTAGLPFQALHDGSCMTW